MYVKYYHIWIFHVHPEGPFPLILCLPVKFTVSFLKKLSSSFFSHISVCGDLCVSEDLPLKVWIKKKVGRFAQDKCEL